MATPQRSRRSVATRRAAAETTRRPSELQRSRSELSELRAMNQELRQRVAALQSELSTSRKQVDLLRARAAGSGDPRRRRLPASTPLVPRRGGKRGKVFGAAVVASLLGLGLRALRRP